MKIVTWNVNTLRVRLPQVLDWLQSHAPDVLCVQETKIEDRDFPQAEINEAGYEWTHFWHDVNSAGITLWGAAIDTLENTSRFAKGASTGPIFNISYTTLMFALVSTDVAGLVYRRASTGMANNQRTMPRARARTERTAKPVATRKMVFEISPLTMASPVKYAIGQNNRE